MFYKIASRLDISPAEGPWTVRMTVEPKNANKAISEVIRQMREMQKAPPSSMELEDAKYALIGGLPVSLETNENIADMLLNVMNITGLVMIISKFQ